MASTAALSDTERTLRIITILTWIPTFAMLLPFGIMTDLVVPSLGIMPMTLSTLFVMAQLYRKRFRCGRIIAMDLFIAVYLAAFIVAGLCFIARRTRRRYDRAQLAVLGTLGTAPMIVNWTIHVFFVLKEIHVQQLFAGIFSSSTCPHCQRELRLRWNGSNGFRTQSSDSRNGYDIVQKGYADESAGSGPLTSEMPRTSTDDEAARLL